MERLVKLLNEYNGEDTFWIDECDDSNGNCSCFICRGDGTECFVDEHIISKKFGFIKWLVDNDKIDRGKFEVEYTDKQTLKDVYIAGAKQDELIIMLLAISDTPIDDLISYLK